MVALTAAAGVASAAGSVMSGMQANAAGKYEQRIADRNAALSHEAALESIESGKRERKDFGRKVGAVKGQQIASMAANGIDVGFGAGLRTQEDTAALASEDAENLYHNEDQRTRGFAIDALNYRESGKAARRQGKQALGNSFVQAGTTLLGTASQMRTTKAKMKAGRG